MMKSYQSQIDLKVLNLVFNNVIALFVFSLIYSMLFTLNKDNFKGAQSFLDIIYFTTTTQSTIGYGDITPNTQIAKSIVMIHHLVVLAIATHFVVSIVRK